MKKKKVFIAILIFWAILLFAFIGYKEFSLQTGEKILLKTTPVDPRDMFRGDYVILDYEISSLNINDYANVFLINEGDTIFVSLEKTGKYWTAKNLYQASNEELTIKGRVTSVRGSSINIEYGIESFFVPEGEGKELEKYRGSENLSVEVSVDKFGNGIITTLYIDDEEWIAP